MGICVLGISHKTAANDMLEKWLSQPSIIRDDLEEVAELPKVLLSTCNRWEMYLDTSHISSVLEALKDKCGFFPRDHFYLYEADECFKHLCKVTSGIESRILSETEIQAQVKKSYLASAKKHILTPPLHYLFQKALFISKKARTLFPIPRGIPSLERVVFDLLKDYRKMPILLVGNSQINRQIIAYLLQKGSFEIVVCTDHPAQPKENIRYISKHEITTWPFYPAVILATQSPSPLVKFKHLADHPLETKLIIDLGMPRNSELPLKKLDCLDVYDWDQICSSMESSRRGLSNQIDVVEHWLTQVIEEFYSHKKSRFMETSNPLVSEECTTV